MTKHTKTLIAFITLSLLLTIVVGGRDTLAQVGTAVKNGFVSCSGANCDNVLTIGGTASASSAATLTGFVSAPSNATYKIARGSSALDGANPTPMSPGLTTLVACVVSLNGTAAPGVGTSIVTSNVATTTLNVYAWKVTTSADTTLIASTGTETVNWVCVGT